MFAYPRRRLAAVTLILLFAPLGCASPDPRIAEREARLWSQPSRWHEPDPASEPSEPPPRARSQPEEAGLAGFIRFALENNPGLRAAFDHWVSRLEEVPQALALPDPRLAFSHLFEPVETRTGPQRNRLRIEQTFPWFGRRAARGAAAEQAAQVAWWQVEQKRVALVQAVTHAWLDSGELSHATRIEEDGLELLRRLEPVVQRLVQSGKSQNNLLLLQQAIGQAENQHESLLAQIRVLSSRLAALAGQHAATLPAPPALSEGEPVLLDRQTLWTRMLADNPSLSGLRAEIEREARRVDLAELEGWPDLTLGIDLLETGSSVLPNQRGDGDDPVGVGLSLRLPLGRDRIAAGKRQARASLRAARRRLAQRENELHAELEQTLFEVDDAARQAALCRDSLLPRARQSWELLEIDYRTGKASLQLLIAAQQRMLDLDRTYWRAIGRWSRGMADIDALCAGGVR